MTYFRHHCGLIAAFLLSTGPAPADGPRPLPAGAVTADWPRFLGATDNAISSETGIEQSFSAPGPKPLWAFEKGQGYASPAVAGGRLVLFHRKDSREVIDCLESETGKKQWSHSYLAEYRDDFGYSDGPRAGPVIAGEYVYTFGVASHLSCLELKTGRLVWQHDCAKEFGVPQYFFGSGASPLVSGEVLVVNLGGSEDRCVCAFDLKDGKLRWTTKHAWGQSYASPIQTSLGGQKRIVVFAGGKSDPSTGGVLSIDPTNGTLEDSFFWRARRGPSVNAATPVVCGDHGILVSQAYVDRDSPCNGSVLLKLNEARKWEAVWKEPALGCHWTTPVYKDGFIYAFSGEKDRSCQLVCHDVTNGQEKWSKQFTWDQANPGGADLPMGLYRGSLLLVGGKFLCMGEWGTLCWLDLTPQGADMLSKFQPFTATQSWTLPALSRGLLYVSQNEPDRVTKAPSRLLCFDLRKGAK